MARRPKRRRQKPVEKPTGTAKSARLPDRISDQQAQDLRADLALAKQHHAAGRLSQAERIYRKVRQTDPNHPEALRLLGVIARQAGKSDLAIELIKKAIAARPDHPGGHNNLGNVLLDLGRTDEAVACFNKSLAISPDYAEAHYNLGRVFQLTGQLDEAEASYRQTLAIKPDYAEAHNNLGNALLDMGRASDAVASFDRAITINPRLAEAHYNRANALEALGRLEEAVNGYRQAIDLEPNYFEAHNNLGTSLKSLGRLDEALTCYRQALAISPEFAEAHFNLANALDAAALHSEAILSYNEAIAIKPDWAEAHTYLGSAQLSLDQLNDAVASFRRALALKPDFAVAHNALGLALQTQGRFDDAIASHRQAIRLEPDLAEAHNSLGNALKELARVDEAIASYRKALDIKPDFSVAHSNLLFAMHCEAADPGELLKAHRRSEKGYAKPQSDPTDRRSVGDDPDRRLRVGFVSGDFRNHSVSYFLERPFASYDHQRLEFYCYSNFNLEDATTARLRSSVDQWRTIADLKDEQVIDAVRVDGIDILVDLSGHTKGHRLAVFAAKPAPVQVTWLGYPDTTGLSAIDYRLSDAIADPPGDADVYCVERLVRLPNGFLCYQPPDDAPEVAPLPMTDRGHVTFASFNNLAKVTPQVVESWARILQSVPNSRLLFKNKSLAASSARKRYAGLFAEHGIAPERIDFRAQLASTRDHLALYGDADLALDTFPYNGTTTTCEALWMGVPTITWRGDRHSARVGASLLSRLGLDDLVADHIEGYEQTAIALAQDPDRLTALRTGLRDRMRASQVCDGAAFARDLEQALRNMWHAWCHAGAADPHQSPPDPA